MGLRYYQPPIGSFRCECCRDMVFPVSADGYLDWDIPVMKPVPTAYELGKEVGLCDYCYVGSMSLYYEDFIRRKGK